MTDADPGLSRILLAHATLGAALNLASSARTSGPLRAALLALGTGFRATGELLATGPLKLLRHRTRPRIAGVPVAVLLGWYRAINGPIAVAANALDALPLDETTRKRLLPPSAALVGASLDLVLDPAGLDAGLWEWNDDGVYAGGGGRSRASTGRVGCRPSTNAGWLLLVGGVASVYGRAFKERGPAGRLPTLLSCCPRTWRPLRWRWVPSGVSGGLGPPLCP